MAKPDPDADWWTTTDAARYLGVHPNTVSSYRLRGQIPIEDAVFLGKRVWKPSTIITWHAQRRGRGWRKGQKSKED